jgi:type II secretory pathway component PulJ
MKRPDRPARFRSVSAGAPPGYTLVEILVATALTLIMVAAVVKIFGDIGESVNQSRDTLEMADRLRAARARLEMDLAGITVTMLPPRRPESGEGYFEYTEGPVGPRLAPSSLAKNTDDPANSSPDTTVGDFDDVLLFTTRSTGRPFVGLYWDPSTGTQSTIESDVAEIAWFMRGRTLYRRVLLVVPGAKLDKPAGKAFFAVNDISVRLQGGVLVPNTLGDLTKHESRYAHPVTGGYPCHPHFSLPWKPATPSSFTIWATVMPGGKLGLGLPTLRECCALAPSPWPTGDLPPTVSLTSAAAFIDFWAKNPYPWPEVDPVTGTLKAYLDPNNSRIAEDVILTDVIGFDVKAWDPGAQVVSDGNVALGPSDPGYKALVSSGGKVVSYGAYVDLNYNGIDDPRPNPSAFAGPGDPRSGMVRVYDTWSSHYEDDGIDQDGKLGPDQGTNGFDDDNNGIVDDAAEMEVPPPYPVPLQAIQVKIRVYEPDSRQIREVTVVQDFLPK